MPSAWNIFLHILRRIIHPFYVNYKSIILFIPMFVIFTMGIGVALTFIFFMASLGCLPLLAIGVIHMGWKWILLKTSKPVTLKTPPSPALLGLSYGFALAAPLIDCMCSTGSIHWGVIFDSHSSSRLAYTGSWTMPIVVRSINAASYIVPACLYILAEIYQKIRKTWEETRDSLLGSSHQKAQYELQKSKKYKGGQQTNPAPSIV